MECNPRMIVGDRNQVCRTQLHFYKNKILILFVCVTIEEEVESHLSDASGYHGAKKGGWNKKFLWYYLSIFQSFLAWFGIIFVFFPDF